MTEPLTPYLLRYGYERGYFPMGMEDGEIGWFEPTRRALFPIEGIRVSRSLAKKLRHTEVDDANCLANPRYRVTFDLHFEDVIRGCLRPAENWITEEIIQVYTQVYRQGWAHCAEVWSEGELIGGVYGLAIEGCFSAESMFHRERDASKIALWAMVRRCRELGFTLFDAQVMNPHLASLGAYEVSNRAYLRLLGEALTITTGWSG